jgi:hypothetical protein
MDAKWKKREGDSMIAKQLDGKQLRADLAKAQAEDNYLRAYIANSDGPCLYCKLHRDDWGKCASGFPGCARADDALLGSMLCPSVGASPESKIKHNELAARLLAGYEKFAKTVGSADEDAALFLEHVRDAAVRIVELEAQMARPIIIRDVNGLIKAATHIVGLDPSKAWEVTVRPHHRDDQGRVTP